MELHFYPRQHLLVVRNGRAIIGKFEAWGGPANIVLHPGAMREEPTWPGAYVIANAVPYHTPSWKWSRIKWGTRLKDMGDDVQYQLPNGVWASVGKDMGISYISIRALTLALYGKEFIPKTWVFNDFGPIAIRWFKDSNQNRVLDRNERLSGQMFHTTPANEAQFARKLPVKMTGSHGCIHLKPDQRDKLFAIGAFKPKTIFVIHRYDEYF